MRLTSFTDYGLRMLMRMASDPGRPFSTAELAGEFGLKRNHLAKIMQRLAHVGLLETRRGGGGGALLARAPESIRLGDIVERLRCENNRDVLFTERFQPFTDARGEDGIVEKQPRLVEQQ